MIERGDGVRFTLETFVELGVAGFDGDAAVEAGESRAFHTSPMPPSPIRERISYGPSFAPEESGMIFRLVYIIGLDALGGAM